MTDQKFRDIMAASPSPVTVITATSAAGPIGCTVSAFMSLSMSPQMIAVALDRRSSVLAGIDETGLFGVNILAVGQAEVAVQFAGSAANRFTDVPWWYDDGLPQLLGTSAWLACRLSGAVEAGDHQLLMGQVLSTGQSRLPAMVYADRRFGTHSELSRLKPASLAQQLTALAL